MASKAQEYERAASMLYDTKPVFDFRHGTAEATEDMTMAIKMRGVNQGSIWIAAGDIPEFVQWLIDTFVTNRDEEEEEEGIDIAV